MGIKYRKSFAATFGKMAVDAVKEELKSTAETFHKEVTKGGASGGYLINPVITGRLRASWDINTTGAFHDAGEGEHGSPGALKAPMDTKDVLYVTNGAPYVGFVEMGINPRPNVDQAKLLAHRKFIKYALHRTTKK